MADTDSARELRVTKNDGYQLWEMSFPPANAIGPEFLAAMDRSLDDAVADESVAAIVLTSSLRIFSAGADASWMAALVRDHGVDELLEQFNRTMDDFRALCGRMRRAPLLVIAALNGHTLAGGLELAAACDLRFVAETATIKIGVPEMDLFGAMPSGGGGVQFLARLMHPSRALQFILDGKPISPQAAYAEGLVDRVVDADHLLAAAETYASELARKAGRVAVAATKRSVFDGVEMTLAEGLDFDRALHWDAMRRGNFKARVHKFLSEFG
jgi:enoyl-CoA hydratase